MREHALQPVAALVRWLAPPFGGSDSLVVWVRRPIRINMCHVIVTERALQPVAASLARWCRRSAVPARFRLPRRVGKAPTPDAPPRHRVVAGRRVRGVAGRARGRAARRDVPRARGGGRDMTGHDMIVYTMMPHGVI